MYIDPMYWYFAIPGLILTFLAQMYVKFIFNKYSSVDSGKNLTGEEVAKLLRDKEGFSVDVEASQEPLGDHFDPTKNIVRLSKRNRTSKSVADIAVVAHEFGHVQQKSTSWGIYQFRQLMVPVTNFGTQIGYAMFFIGLALSIVRLAEIGLLFFSTSVLFSLVTLPVELNASNRAMKMIGKYSLVSKDNEEGAKAVLNAAALTYFAGLLSSILNLLYYLNIFKREKKN